MCSLQEVDRHCLDLMLSILKLIASPSCTTVINKCAIQSLVPSILLTVVTNTQQVGHCQVLSFAPYYFAWWKCEAPSLALSIASDMKRKDWNARVTRMHLAHIFSRMEFSSLSDSSLKMNALKSQHVQTLRNSISFLRQHLRVSVPALCSTALVLHSVTMRGTSNLASSKWNLMRRVSNLCILW